MAVKTGEEDTALPELSRFVDSLERQISTLGISDVKGYREDRKL